MKFHQSGHTTCEMSVASLPMQITCLSFVCQDRERHSEANILYSKKRIIWNVLLCILCITHIFAKIVYPLRDRLFRVANDDEDDHEDDWGPVITNERSSSEARTTSWTSSSLAFSTTRERSTTSRWDSFLLWASPFRQTASSQMSASRRWRRPGPSRHPLTSRAGPGVSFSSRRKTGWCRTPGTNTIKLFLP